MPVIPRTVPFALRALLAAVACASAAIAQMPPKPGPWYEDKTDLGFKVQVPKDYDFVPPQPMDPEMIGHYAGPEGQGVFVVARAAHWPIEVHLVKFDRRKKDDAPLKPGEVRKSVIGCKDLPEYIEHHFLSDANFKPDGDKKLKVGKVDATEYQYAGKLDGVEVRLYAALFKLSPDVDVALIGNGPGDSKKWSRFEGAFRDMAKTLKLLDVAERTATAAGGALRDQKRAKLQDEITRLPGWKLYETPNYFLISNSDDEGFMKELMERLEAIRKIYEETYPAAQALELRRKAAAQAAAKTGGGNTPPDASKPPEKKDESKQEGDEEDEEERPMFDSSVDPMEASRTCVVRVCTDEKMYHDYGGPGGSAGYWSPFHEELVVYDDKKDGGRSNTWKTLNHEAFHQYCFYFYGNLAPHSWYNEGTGDFYSGYQYGKNKRFTLKPFDWRVPPVQEMLREKKYLPLKKLVRYTQGEYYGNNKDGMGPGECYAQGWSLIYFLRTAPGKARGWNPAWATILPTYLETLVITGKLDQAVDKAFANVDWDALEACWSEYLDKEI